MGTSGKKEGWLTSLFRAILLVGSVLCFIMGLAATSLFLLVVAVYLLIAAESMRGGNL